MKKLLLTATATACLLTTLPALAQNVAIVNGKAVPSSRVEMLAREIAASGRPITPDLQSRIKTEVIAREIFMQEAEGKGLNGSEEYKAKIELARQAILIQQLFDDYRKTHPVTDADIQAEYARYVAASGGKEYHARHILVESENEAKALIAQIKKGAKFEEVARKSSKDAGSGSNGGDLDWANAGSYVKEFSTGMVALKKGQMTDAPVRSQFGYHIIRLDDVRDAQVTPLEQMRPQIAQQLEQQRLTAYQQELRDKAKVQ